VSSKGEFLTACRGYAVSPGLSEAGHPLMDAFNSDSHSQKESDGKNDSGVESVTGMFSGQPRTPSQSAPLPGISFHSEPPNKTSQNPQPDHQPGEFTQFFQSVTPAGDPVPATPVKPTLPERRLATADERSPAVTDLSRVFTQLAKPQPRPSAAPPPGEFTQLMDSFSSGSASRPQAPPPSNPQPFRIQPESAGSGISPATQATNAEGSSSGSFTNYFQSVSTPVTKPESSSSPSQLRGNTAPSGRDAPPAPENVNRTDSRDALTQIFAGVSDPPVQASRSFFGAPEPASYRHGEGGDFTKLFEALSEAPAAADRLQFSSQPLAPSKAPGQEPPMQPDPGGFTRLMSALGQNPQPMEAAIPEPIPAPSPLPPQGPSEFTRILSPSLKSERQEAALQADSPQGIGPASLRAAAAPLAAALPLQALPAAPFAPPAMHGSMPPSVLPPLQSHAPPLASPLLPKPTAQGPAPTKVLPVPKNKLQELLPILLVINAFLMLLVVILAIFLLRRH
jgi:hypothetical protein